MKVALIIVSKEKMALAFKRVVFPNLYFRGSETFID